MNSINSWVEAPKSKNVLNVVRKYCLAHNLTIHKLESVPVGRDFLDKLCGVNRETIYFHLEGDYDALDNLKTQLELEAKKTI